MVVDTSALLAILQREPEQISFTQAIEAAESKYLSVASFVEASIVFQSHFGSDGLYELDAFIDEAGIELRAVDLEQATVARRAYNRYGKGNHRASLNYGDCFSYALAEVTGEPLLFKGNDFAQTDIPAVETTS